MNLSNETLLYEWYPRAQGVSCLVLKLLACWLTLDMILGLVMNGLVIFVYLKHKDLQSATNTFLVNISLCDFIACLIEIPLPMLSAFMCKWPFGKVLCYFEAFVAYFCGCASIWLLVLVSFDRYIAIALPFEHTRVTLKVQRVCVAMCWLNAFLWASAPLLGWSKYAFEGTRISCAIEWHSNSLSVLTYNLCIFVFVLVVPLTIMCVTNFKLYLTIRNLGNNDLWKKDDAKAQKKLKIEKKVAKSCAMIICGFVLAWSPYACVSLISTLGYSHLISPLMATLPALVAKSQVIWNPLIYVAFNKNFRNKLVPLRVKNKQREKCEASEKNSNSIEMAQK